jgi:hypothetical protein
VSVTSPFNSLALDAPAAINFSAVAYDDDGTVNRVEFFVNDSKVAEDTSLPFSVALSSLAPGEYALRARAIDSAGAVTSSSAVPRIQRRELEQRTRRVGIRRRR